MISSVEILPLCLMFLTFLLSHGSRSTLARRFWVVSLTVIFRLSQSVHISNVPVHGGLLSECFVTILALVELDPHMNGHVFSQAVLL